MQKKFEIKLISKSYARTEYRVEKAFGDWPPYKELIDMCEKGNFGGFVSKSKDGKTAFVAVYTD